MKSCETVAGLAKELDVEMRRALHPCFSMSTTIASLSTDSLELFDPEQSR
jgi:hypothetical protein